jgi:hypothetical protein
MKYSCSGWSKKVDSNLMRVWELNSALRTVDDMFTNITQVNPLSARKVYIL